MPSVENWQTQPLKIIQGIYENHNNSEWKGEVLKYFEAKLGDSENISVIPSLNDCPAHELSPNSLVRFRCMIQDTFDNEFFPETYKVTDKENNTVTKISCFRDILGCPNDCNIDVNFENSTTGMRQVLYCVSIPAETYWVKEAWKSEFVIKPNKEIPCTSSTSKRVRDIVEDDIKVEAEDADTQAILEANTQKKIRNSSQPSESSDVGLTLVDKNHPLPGENGPVCLVKVCDESAEFKVNEMIEFYGILSVDPGLSGVYDSSEAGDNGSMEAGNIEEARAHNPPASLVPRLHAVAVKRLQHNNPLLISDVDSKLRSSIQKDASTIRSGLLGLLEKAMLGDSLAAEYMLLHLLARVYYRRDMLSLGKFSLNISGIPPDSPYPRILAKFLKELVTKLHYLPLSIEKFNELRFIPTKNYSTYRLDAGILQLSDGTHLVLDEAMLNPGTMDANGVKNIQALKNMMAFQKVDYDFQFHEASFECDINVLVFSEGKSLLPCDCQIELNPTDGLSENMEEYFASICSQCPVEFVNKCRAYIGCTRLAEYELNEEMTEKIQDDFVSARRENVNQVTADDLHAWLVLARLMSISVGQSSLSPQRWERVKALEAQRKERFSQHTARHNGL